MNKAQLHHSTIDKRKSALLFMTGGMRISSVKKIIADKVPYRKPIRFLRDCTARYKVLDVMMIESVVAMILNIAVMPPEFLFH